MKTWRRTLQRKLRSVVLTNFALRRVRNRWQLVEARDVILEWKDSQFPKAAHSLSWQLKLASLVRQQTKAEEQNATKSRLNAKGPRLRQYGKGIQEGIDSDGLDADIDRSIEDGKNPNYNVAMWSETYSVHPQTVRRHIRKRKLQVARASGR